MKLSLFDISLQILWKKFSLKVIRLLQQKLNKLLKRDSKYWYGNVLEDFSG